MRSEYCMVFTTISKKEEAKKLAKSILDKRLASCIQLEKIDSLYIWEEKVFDEEEYLLRIKTKSSLYKELEKYIKINHSYDLPQIIKLSIDEGYEEYLKWIDSVTKD